MKLRVHGDNVLECERAVRIIAAALGDNRALVPQLSGAPLWAPTFLLMHNTEPVDVQLFPGYGRWPLDIQEELRNRGAPLREMVDAIVTELHESSVTTEEPILALEFCGALPAGNQAW